MILSFFTKKRKHVEIEDTGFPSDGLLKETYLEKMTCLEKKNPQVLSVEG